MLGGTGSFGGLGLLGLSSCSVRLWAIVVGIGWVSFRACFVSRSLFYLVSRVAPLGRRAFRLANVLRLLLLSRRTWKLPREHVL